MRRFIHGLAMLCLTAFGVAGAVTESTDEPIAVASDHDDGETDIKSRSLNLTDVYAFREDWQTGVGADDANLILILNSGNRNVARQYYPFSSVGVYQINLSRVSLIGDTPTGAEDVVFQFRFAPPDVNNQQAVTVTLIQDGNTFTSSGSILTTAIGPSPVDRGGTGTTEVNNNFSLGGVNMTLFAGLREDPFFFDVEQYFRVRAGARNKPTGSAGVAFRAAATAVDFTAGYNVNSIVLRVPIASIGGTGNATIFDVWGTIHFVQ